jgi:LAO/AO transport system kinase
MHSTIQEFLDGIRSGNSSARRKLILSRMISLIENEQNQEIHDVVFQHVGRAYRIGLTGPPGAGKSTLVGALAKILAEEGKEVGIIAVDPTSPFTGGAILGDRLRMNEVAVHPNIFIRSMATRGATGGLVKTAMHVADVMDAYGMDVIIFETVGVGQSEIDIVRHADTTVVVLVPDYGDGVQAMKAGLMEIGDAFVVNKSDHVHAAFMKKELEGAIELRHKVESAWRPEVVKTVATENTGTEDVLKLIAKHKAYLISSGKFAERRKERIRYELLKLIEAKIQNKWVEPEFLKNMDRYVESIISKKESIYHLADKISNSFFNPPQGPVRKGGDEAGD